MSIEQDTQFDIELSHAREHPNVQQWVDFTGHPVKIDERVAPNEKLWEQVSRIQAGELLGQVKDLVLRDPNSYRAGELYNHVTAWEAIAGTPDSHSPPQAEMLQGIRNRVSLFRYMQHYKGSFQRVDYDSPQPPPCIFRNNPSCQQFRQFIQKTLVERVKSGAISLFGKVGQVAPPHSVHPLTV